MSKHIQERSEVDAKGGLQGSDPKLAFSSFFGLFANINERNDRLPPSVFRPNFLQSKFRVCVNIFKKDLSWTPKGVSRGAIQSRHFSCFITIHNNVKNERLPPSVFGPNFLQSKFRA